MLGPYLKMNFACVVAFGAILAIGTSPIALADPVEDFYKGKQITMLVGSDPGGGYDLLARLTSRHLGDHIPGKPRVVVENMPGAGSVLLSNRIYNVAPKDGTFIGLVQRGILISELTSQPGLRYELDKFNWLGSLSAEVAVVTMWHDSPVSTLKEAQEKEVVLGGTGSTSDSEASARMLNAVMGTKFKIVSGYPGTADVLLAMERGELNGIGDLSWSEVKSKNAQLLADHKLKFIGIHGFKRAPDLPDIPLALDYVKDPADRPVAELYYEMKEVARPILSAPGIPAERVAALRNAFDAMVKDPAYLADAKANRLELEPAGHGEIEKFLNGTKQASPAIRERLTQILNTKK